VFTRRITSILHVSLKNDEMKDRSWSVISVDPLPRRMIIWVASSLAHVSADWSGMAKASAYLVKWSIKVSRYLFLHGVTKYGPVVLDVTSKGVVGSSTSPSGATNSLSSFRL